jgi:hypothetical protein
VSDLGLLYRRLNFGSCDLMRFLLPELLVRCALTSVLATLPAIAATLAVMVLLASCEKWVLSEMCSSDLRLIQWDGY